MLCLLDQPSKLKEYNIRLQASECRYILKQSTQEQFYKRGNLQRKVDEDSGGTSCADLFCKLYIVSAWHFRGSGLLAGKCIKIDGYLTLDLRMRSFWPKSIFFSDCRRNDYVVTVIFNNFSFFILKDSIERLNYEIWRETEYVSILKSIDYLRTMDAVILTSFCFFDQINEVNRVRQCIQIFMQL